MLIWFKRIAMLGLALVVVYILLAFFPLANIVKIETPSGVLLGKQKHGVEAFLAVPFAQAPIGDLRWQAPQPLEKWQGERKAFRKGPACLQGASPNPALLLGESEDCLYLNIWKPEGEGPFPVMVWFHGGAFLLGSGSEGSYEGAKLAKVQQVIVVTTNYRLSYLGFLRFPEFVGEDKGETISGNQGYLDQIAALQWLKDNIQSFSGDSENITIFGESAGSISVCMLLASPLSNGLIHKAIMQSGSCELQSTQKPDEAESYGQEFLQRIGCAQHEKPLSCARQKSHDEIYKALGIKANEIFKGGFEQWSFNPRVVKATDFMPDEPLLLLEKNEKSEQVALMIGVTAHEGSLFDGMNPHAKPGEDWAAFLETRFPEKGKLIAQVYPWDQKIVSGEVSAQILTDSVMTCPALKIADIWSTTRPVYLYYFNQKVTAPLFELMSLAWTDNAAELGTAHSTEIPYIFGMNGVLGFVLSAEQKHTQKLMQHYWANFARNAQPNAEGLFEWLPYTHNEKSFLEFKDGAHQGSDLRKAYCEFWQQNPIDFSGRRGIQEVEAKP